jgi:hypothetical protein
LKKITISFFFFFLVISSFGQITLTTGEVFNFSPGDEFLVKETITGFFPHQLNYRNYTRTTILNKTYSTLLDTVFYEWRIDNQTEQFYYPGGGPPTSTITYQTYTASVSFTDLSLSAEDYATNNYYIQPDPCYTDSIDTVFVSIPYCNKKSWHKEYTGFSSCFEAPMPVSELTEGCGISYNKHDDYATGNEEIQELIFYKKGTDSCDTNQNVATSISNNTKLNPFHVGPIPSTGIFSVYFETPISYELEVYDIEGKRILKTAKTNNRQASINLTNEKSGGYFIKVITENDIWKTQVIKE